ncbi:MAG: hypothetical protein J5997_06045 [Oscillospiraceae bacterium]|nr:hypothetical protein [Oscillospiraceae bacterium]
MAAKRLNISEGMMLGLKNESLTSNYVHCKVIVPKIISDDEFINGCSLLFLYEGTPQGKRRHNFSSLISVKLVHFQDGIPKELKYIGDEKVFDWERNLDIGIKSCQNGSWITASEISDLEHNHLILSSDSSQYIAIPFYDVNNVQLDHIPIIQLQDGCTTFTGLLKEMTF